MIFVWLVLPHIKTLTIIRRKTIRLCVCNCLWVTSSAKYSPPAFLNVFFFSPPICSSNACFSCVVLSHDRAVRSLLSPIRALHFPCKAGAMENIRFCSFWQEEKKSELKTGAGPCTLIFYHGCQHALSLMKRSPWLLHFRDSFLTISSLSRYCLNFCLHLSCLPALNTWHVVLLFKY